MGCPEDVKLLKHDGVTEIDLKRSVEVVSQDRSTVTVNLRQGWENPRDELRPIDHIFYSYRHSTFDVKCYEKTEVVVDALYDTITIECGNINPLATIEICLVDDVTNNLL